MPKRKTTPTRAIAVRIAISLVVVIAGVWVLAKNWFTVQTSVQTAQHAHAAWLAAGLVLITLTFCIAAGIYGVLALHALRYRQTVLIEVATAFVNKLLPAGIGGLGLHGMYLYKRGHTAAEATVVVSVNNLVGMAAHLLLLSEVLARYPSLLHEFTDGRHLDWRVVAVVLLGVAAVWMVPAVRRRLQGFARNLLASVRRLSIGKLAKALVLAMFLTLTYTAILVCASRSVGIELGVLQVFVVFSVGMLAATATPTPGGLVGAEAGLFAGFVAYGVPAAAAGAAVLLYRLLSYWVPLLPGAVALVAARRSRLV